MSEIKRGKYNPTKTISFVTTQRDRLANGGKCAFRSYTDIAGVFGNPGAPVIFDDGSVDPRSGKPIGKFFLIDQQHYNFTANVEQKDATGKKLIDFLSAYPGCEGSPNGSYSLDEDGNEIQVGVEYRIADTEDDAETILDGNTNRAKAQISAAEIDSTTLVEMASYIGMFGQPSKLMRQKVQEWAGKKPVDYFKALNEGDRSARSLIRNCVADGTFKIQGTLIKWEGTIIGTDEDSAVKTLLDNPDMLEALKAKAALGAQVEIKKKPGRQPSKPQTA